MTSTITRRFLPLGCALVLAWTPAISLAAPADSAWVPTPGHASPPPDSMHVAPDFTRPAIDSTVASPDTSSRVPGSPIPPADTLLQTPPDTTRLDVTAPPARESVTTPPPRAARPRVGLVLSGGAARGAAHIGLLQVLEEHRIPVDDIAGTSMGALIGGLYASGLSPERLDSVVTSTDWLDAFTDKARRADRTFCRKRDDDLLLMKSRFGIRGRELLVPPSTLDGHRIDLILKRLTLPAVFVRDFDRLGIPFRAVAADLVTGEEVVLDHGDLAQAMRASMSVPAAFTAREIDGRLLVDGGIIDNLPVDVARKMGADVIVAMDIAPRARERDDLYSLPIITYHLTIVAGEQNRKRQIASLGERDVFIRPDMGKVTLASFDRADEAIAIGRAAAEAALPALERYALPPEEYREYLVARARRIPEGGVPEIARVEVESRSRVDDAVLAKRLDVPAGPLDLARLEKGLDRLAGLELFESTTWDIGPGPDGNVLTVTANPRPWGPDYVQAGVAVFDDYRHPNFNLALAYTRTEVNRLDGEWTAALQVGQEPAVWGRWHQPVDNSMRWFAEARPSWAEWAINDFDANGHERAEYGVTQYGIELAAGREIGSWAEARAGIVRKGGEIRQQAGEPVQPSWPIDTGELFGQFYADELDGVAFPRHGFLLRARAAAGLNALNSAATYEQIEADGVFARSRGRNTGVAGATLGVTADSDAPLESRFRLGGLGRLSGLEQEEQIGQQALLVRAMGYRRVLELFPVYAGVSLEYGNTFATREDIKFDLGIPAACLFAGAETPLGPVILAWGLAEGGRTNFYLTLGQAIGLRTPGLRMR